MDKEKTIEVANQLDDIQGMVRTTIDLNYMLNMSEIGIGLFDETKFFLAESIDKTLCEVADKLARISEQIMEQVKK